LDSLFLRLALHRCEAGSCWHARVGNLGLDVPDRLLALADEVIE
jgi:hypothetical protein